MNNRWIPRLVAPIITLAVLAVVPAAQAEVNAGENAFEIYAGIYSPDVDALDDDPTFGIRFNHNVNQRFNMEGTLGFFSSDGREKISGVTVDLDYDVIFTEFSFAAMFRPMKRAHPMLFGGPGWAFVSGDVKLSGPLATVTFNDLEDDSFMLHMGFGTKFHIGDRTYIRLATRWRWFENREEDDLDKEVTIALGIKFGGGY